MKGGNREMISHLRKGWYYCRLLITGLIDNGLNVMENIHSNNTKQAKPMQAGRLTSSNQKELWLWFLILIRASWVSETFLVTLSVPSTVPSLALHNSSQCRAVCSYDDIVCPLMWCNRTKSDKLWTRLSLAIFSIAIQQWVLEQADPFLPRTGVLAMNKKRIMRTLPRIVTLRLRAAGDTW